MPSPSVRTLAAALLTLSLAAGAAEAPSAAVTSASASAPLDARMQALKSEVVRMNRELQLLEDELLFPPATQLAVFVSLEGTTAFEPQSVRVMLDDQLLAAHLYTASEVQTLRRGGVQRLFVGNLRSGKHQIAAQLLGRAPQQPEIRRSATIEIDKGSQGRTVELKIRDLDARLPPEFEVKVGP